MKHSLISDEELATAISQALANPSSRLSAFVALVRITERIEDAQLLARRLPECIPPAVRDALLKSLDAAHQHSRAAALMEYIP